METIDDIVLQKGFESLNEFYRLVANTDLSSTNKLASFRRWQNEDGTKEGLLKLAHTGIVDEEETP